jgi:transaldolase
LHASFLAFIPNFNAILGLLKHPLTDIGLEKFLADYEKANG